MTLKRLAEQADVFKELPSGMQLRKRPRLADEFTTPVAQQIETTDFQEYRMEDDVGQDIQIELDEGLDYYEGTPKDVVFEAHDIEFEKVNE